MYSNFQRRAEAEARRRYKSRATRTAFLMGAIWGFRERREGVQGIFIDGRRPKTKKEVKDLAASEPERVMIEATSVFGNEYDGRLSEMPPGEIFFVGPDPELNRKFYGQIIRFRNGNLVVK